MKKKLLITLRHPGPADAILPIIPKLSKKFDIYVVITNSAIDILNSRYNSCKIYCKIYFPSKSIENGFSESLYHESFKTEFTDKEVCAYRKLYNVFEKLVLKINPDVALRTTPSYEWGIDEILPRIAKESLPTMKVFCYQEYYGVGKAFHDNENIIASVGCNDTMLTVDSSASNFMLEKDINAIPLGWLSHMKYLDLESYSTAKKKVREHYKIDKNSKVILYACISSGSFLEELHEFKKVLFEIRKLMLNNKKIKLFIKYHPRNTFYERNMYKTIIEEFKINVRFFDDKLPYNWALALPDIVISICSGFNIDAVAYSLVDESLSKLKYFLKSIYIYNSFTKKIFIEATGKNIIPSHLYHSGHIIIEKNIYSSLYKTLYNDPNFKSNYVNLFKNYKLEPKIIKNLITCLES